MVGNLVTGSQRAPFFGTNIGWGSINTVPRSRTVDSHRVVCIRVPVMLLVVNIVNRSKGWYERDDAVT